MPPTVVWLTIDSLRYDHTSMAGYQRDTTPNMDRIRSSPSGRSFSNCSSHGIWTRPSSGSILTGTHPSRHGLGIHNQVLPPELDTAPELFGEAGYRSVCVSELTNVGPATGLDRGFDAYDGLVEASKRDLALAHPTAFGKFLASCLRHPRASGRSVRTDVKKFLRTAMPTFTNEIITDRLFEQNDSRPTFLYGHYLGPHVPYHPHPAHQERFIDEVDADVREALSTSDRVYGTPERISKTIANGHEVPESDWNALRALYDAEIEYIDRRIGELFDTLESRLDEFVLVVTADHGDLIGERGLVTHRAVVEDALTNVPLVTHGLDVSGDDEQPVQHSDVMKTLLATIDGDHSQFRGVDLRSERREYSFVQRGAYDWDPYEKHNPDFDSSRFHTPRVDAVRTERFKLVQSEERTELFELPDERSDVSEEYPEKRTELSEWARREVEEFGQPIVSAEEADLNDRMKQQLADLGYAEF